MGQTHSANRDASNSDAEDTSATSAVKVLEARAVLEEFGESTTALHRYEPEAPRVSWVQRLLTWVRRL